MAAGGDPVERVRACAVRTRAERTAAMRFVPARIEAEPSLQQRLGDRGLALADGLELLGRVRRGVISRLGLSVISAPPGRIDFVHERCLYSESEDDDWVLLAPGRELMGAPGAWEELVFDDDAIGWHEPLWLLGLLPGVVEATDAGEEQVLGHRCRHYSTIASLPLATSHATRPMAQRSDRTDFDPDRLPIDLWLDDSGRIRRAMLRRGNETMLLELSDFGGPEPIPMPEPGEMIPGAS